QVGQRHPALATTELGLEEQPATGIQAQPAGDVDADAHSQSEADLDHRALRISYPSRRCTNGNPNRPLMQRCPDVTSLSSGDVTLTIALSWTCSSSMQPTPQYGHTVSVTVCRSSSHVPAARISCSLLDITPPAAH